MKNPGQNKLDRTLIYNMHLYSCLFFSSCFKVHHLVCWSLPLGMTCPLRNWKWLDILKTGGIHIPKDYKLLFLMPRRIFCPYPPSFFTIWSMILYMIHDTLHFFYIEYQYLVKWNKMENLFYKILFMISISLWQNGGML